MDKYKVSACPHHNRRMAKQTAGILRKLDKRSQKPLTVIAVGEGANRFYDSLIWEPLGNNCERETTNGRNVRYEFHKMQDGSGDIARALVSYREMVESAAYIHHAHSEDFGLQRKLNGLLGIKLRRPH